MNGADADTEKRVAAEAAAELPQSGMTIGLGTGSTVAFLLPALARRNLTDIRCVATSVATEEQARSLGIPVENFDHLNRLDIAIDGTDEVDPEGWLIKGGGAAHLREKIVAAASTLARLGPDVRLRGVPLSPDNGVIADYLGADYRGRITDPGELADRLESDPGVAAHGLFPPAMVSEVLIGRGEDVERLNIGR